MIRSLAALALILTLLAPASVAAAELKSLRSLVVSEPVTDNAYLTGSDVSIAAPLAADLVAAGGTLTVLAPVGGDALLAGARVDVRKPVAGDVRVAGADILIDSSVGGDLMAAGASITASTTARDMHLVGATVRVAGSGGAVRAYGADIYLSGVIQGDVEVFASDKLFIADDTRILGSLRYDAPQQVVVPQTARIEGGVTYTGSSSFLPTNEEAKRFAIAGAGLFIIVRILAIVLAAGLIAGLFPGIARDVTHRVTRTSVRRTVLYALLGFAVLVATPVLILFLLASFVGALLAFLLAAAYVLLFMLAYVYAGVIAGATLTHALFKREYITWRTAVLGALTLYVIGVVPVLGFLVVAFLTTAATGALVGIAYRAAFSSGKEEFSSDSEPNEA